MSERLHRYEWNGHCLLQDQRGEWVKFAEAEAALQSEQGMARLLRSTLDDQRKIIRSLDGAVAENTKLRAAIQSWEDSAQQGHPSPCTLGPLCPYCEIERLRAELAEAQADRMRGNCKIMADDCDCGLCKREREIERLQGQVADMSLVIERLRTVMQAVASMPGRDWLMAQIALGQALGDGGKQLDWVLRWHSQAATAAGGKE